MQNKDYNRMLVLLFGFLLILIGLFIMMNKNIHRYDNEVETEKKDPVLEENSFVVVEDNYVYDEEKNFIAEIFIPKIDLVKKLYPVGSFDNNVNKNIQILKESSMPDEENSHLILASHSGSSNVAYFNNLKKLEISDDIYIFYDDVKYAYKVYKIFEVEKDGQIIFGGKLSGKYLTLITCKIGTNKQIVVVSKLFREETL